MEETDGGEGRCLSRTQCHGVLYYKHSEGGDTGRSASVAEKDRTTGASDGNVFSGGCITGLRKAWRCKLLRDPDDHLRTRVNREVDGGVEVGGARSTRKLDILRSRPGSVHAVRSIQSGRRQRQLGCEWRIIKATRFLLTHSGRSNADIFGQWLAGPPTLSRTRQSRQHMQ